MAQKKQVAESYVLRELGQVRALTDPLRQRLLRAFAGEPQTTKQVAHSLNENPTKLYHHVEQACTRPSPPTCPDATKTRDNGALLSSDSETIRRSPRHLPTSVRKRGDRKRCLKLLSAMRFRKSGKISGSRRRPDRPAASANLRESCGSSHAAKEGSGTDPEIDRPQKNSTREGANRDVRNPLRHLPRSTAETAERAGSVRLPFSALEIAEKLCVISIPIAFETE